MYLIGSAGRDPEVRAIGSGYVADLSLATTHRFKKDDKWQESTDWHALVAYGRTAEVIRDYVKKGSPLHVEGRLQTRSWDDKASGQKRYKTEIVVEELILLGSGGTKKESSQPSYSPFQSQPATDDYQSVAKDDDCPF